MNPSSFGDIFSYLNLIGVGPLTNRGHDGNMVNGISTTIHVLNRVFNLKEESTPTEVKYDDISLEELGFILNDLVHLDYLYAGPIMEFPACVIRVHKISAMGDPDSLGWVLIGEKNWAILPMAIPLVWTLLSLAP